MIRYLGISKAVFEFIIILKTTKCNLKRLLTHSAVEAARVPHGGLRVMIVCSGQVTVGQSHRILLVS